MNSITTRRQKLKLLILAYLRHRRQRFRRIRTLYVRGINLHRRANSEFVKLVLPMRTLYPDDHFNFFRMTRERFDDLLDKISPLINHARTHRMPISAMERLTLTLR